jgi:hypothetical protein
MKSAKEIGKRGTARYILVECPQCHKERWVSIYAKPSLCRLCATINHLKNVNQARRDVPLSERFWAKVEKTNNCWMWKGAIFKRTGYGQANKNGKSIAAHRLAYELTYGITLPDGHIVEIDHLCRNRLCVNPKHLELVSHRENTLRGIGLTAKYAKATHCSRGHIYNEINTYHRPDGGRDCKLCMKIRGESYRLKKRGVLSKVY